MSAYAQEGTANGSVYAQQGTSSGSAYAGGSGGGTTAPKKKHHGGLLHTLAQDTGAEFVSNLGKDVGNYAVGFAPGVYQLGHGLAHDAKKFAEHPVAYNPKKDSELRHTVVEPTVKQYEDYYGHNVLSHLYNHPLQPILDALTVADLGSTAAAKLGVLGDAGRVDLVTRSPRAISTGEGPVHTDVSATQGLAKVRQTVAHRISTGRPEGIGKGPVRVGGELKQYGRQIQQDAAHHALGRLTDYAPYHKATKGLSDSEWAALNIRSLDIHPDDLAELWKGSPAGNLVTDPKVRKLILQPTKKLARAEQEARILSKQGGELLKQRGLLKDETAQARPDLTKRQASEVLGRPVRQLHGDAYYTPHTLPQDAKPVNPLAMSGGGKGIPRRLGSTKQNTGALALTGKLHLRSDVLGPEFLRRVKYLKYDEIHNALVRGAVRVTRKQIDEQLGGHLPQGWEYVRVKPGQRIPATIKGTADRHTPIEKLIPNPDDLHDSELAKQGFATTDPSQAHTKNGAYFIVPTRTVKAATGEFTRSGDLVHTFVQKPLSVWRAAVLGLRPGFFTNNFVGNSLMYAVKIGGRGALRDLLAAIKEEHGAAVARKALDSPVTPPALRKSLYQEFFPEQIHGTFGRTQSPSTTAIGNAANKASAGYRAVTGAIPKATSAVAETTLRKALVRHYIRTSPEFKQVYRALPKQTRSFEQAARKILNGDTGTDAAAYQRLVSKQVNEALGNYLNLGPAERNVLRNALPFYAWYKAIVTTTAHLAVDTPLRANILGQIGQIGKQWSDSKLGEIPSFLEGAIPIGGPKNGLQTVLSTQGLNPYSTLGQLGKGATGDVSSLGVNPFLQGAFDAYARAKEQSKSGNVSLAKVAGSTLKNMVEDLPASRVISPLPPSKLYPKRNRNSEIFSYLGVPVKKYSLAAAAAQKRAGR